jgi:hypothetical protein
MAAQDSGAERYAAAVDALMREAKPGLPTTQQALALADELGIRDSYAFAELAVWDLGIFGHFDDPADEGPDYQTELESAWTEAQAQFDHHAKKEKRV